MHLVEFDRGEAVYEMPARPELGNPLGVIQGGVATALADAAMAAATTTILTDEEIQTSAITTIDIFARFIRPVRSRRSSRCAPRHGSCGRWAAGLVRGRRAGRRRAGGQVRVHGDPRGLRPAGYIAERGGGSND